MLLNTKGRREKGVVLFGNDEQLRRWKVKCWFCKFSSKPFNYHLTTCHTSVKETGKMERRPRGFIYDIWFISRLKRFQRQVAFRASTHLVQFGNSNSWLGNYFIFNYNFSQTQRAAFFAVIISSTLFFWKGSFAFSLSFPFSVVRFLSQRSRSSPSLSPSPLSASPPLSAVPPHRTTAPVSHHRSQPQPLTLSLPLTDLIWDFESYYW